MSVEAVSNLVRALTRPYPGAQFCYKGNLITAWSVKKRGKSFQKNIEPGKVISVSEGIPIVKCYDGELMITEYEPKVNFMAGDYME